MSTVREIPEAWSQEIRQAVNAASGTNPTATWTARNYGWPTLPGLPVSGCYPVPVPQKTDAPFMLATLAQLLDEGKITEETFARLAERLIQQVR